MDAAHSALVRARATEDALATLRAELRELESGDTLRAPKFEGALGTSIEDLARLHEGHASNMREFSRMLGFNPRCILRARAIDCRRCTHRQDRGNVGTVPCGTAERWD